ncbi:hypothetical protein VNI00_018411 [Paramarasmius palmivorus]|uniref:Integrase catalytic domain-containing protein n=1 Tax=Paramarasmius palmivorus TaxID=297713 RepID=A0AAW0B0R2_9AGAR
MNLHQEFRSSYGWKNVEIADTFFFGRHCFADIATRDAMRALFDVKIFDITPQTAENGSMFSVVYAVTYSWNIRRPLCGQSSKATEAVLQGLRRTYPFTLRDKGTSYFNSSARQPFANMPSPSSSVLCQSRAIMTVRS